MGAEASLCTLPGSLSLEPDPPTAQVLSPCTAPGWARRPPRGQQHQQTGTKRLDQTASYTPSFIINVRVY